MREQHRRPVGIGTLQDVLDALGQMHVAGEITGGVLGEARCAILGYCHAVSKSPAKCKADIAELLGRMDEADALKVGFNPTRWTNLKSLLRRSLNLAGKPTPPARRDKPLAPAWDRLLTRHPSKDVQARLRPFAGWCTDNDIAPTEVNEDVLERYQERVGVIARSRNIPETIKKLRRSWNKLAQFYATEITFLARTWTSPLKWGHEVEVMPQSFQDEMTLFKRARSPETYEEVFRCRPLKHKKAVDQQCQLIMRIVTVLEKCGHDLSQITSFAYLVQPRYFEQIMSGLKKQVEADDLRQLGAYASTVHWLAEKWVKVDGDTLKALKHSMEIVGQRRQEIADSSLDVLEQLDDPVKRRKIKELGDTVHSEFRALGDRATRTNAGNFREALYWELGLTAGWRPCSRARINIETDIRWSGTRRKPIATLTAPKTHEKTELRRKVELPETTSRILRDFMDLARPMLLLKGNPDNPYLFTGNIPDQHIMSAHLSSRSAKLIALRTHVTGATGHKSRHTAVKLHLIENPGDWGTVQEHVGHREVDTTKIFYANVTQVESSKRVQKSLGKR